MTVQEVTLEEAPYHIRSRPSMRSLRCFCRRYAFVTFEAASDAQRIMDDKARHGRGATDAGLGAAGGMGVILSWGKHARQKHRC